MKFGGSSVADLGRLRQVAARVVARANAGPVVVVVSAMGDTTNRLLEQARELMDPPPARELDMLMTTGERGAMALLAVAIRALGRPAISLTGSQCGIITTHQAGCARIIEVRPFRVQDELANGQIVIVGGFQGVSYKRELTTLGRGGSDTTAVALAAALGADCEIYSDVDGIYSADPREVSDAVRLDLLSYEEMEALSRAGARVLHTQAVRLAEARGIAIFARHSDPAVAGETVIRRNPAREPGVLAVTADADVAIVRARSNTPLSPRMRCELTRACAGWGLRFLHIDERGISGVLSRTQRTDADELLVRIRAQGVLDALAIEDRRALVSCVGAGLEDRPDILSAAATTLEAADVALLGVYSDGRALAFVVAQDDRERAVRALHDALITRG
jgi:aspartate kinase